MEDKKYTQKERLKLNRELKPEGKKCCSKCDMVKPVSDFGNSSRSKDGKRSSCKECGNIYNKKHYQDNREQKLMYGELWREENKERFKQIQKNYRDNNREKVLNSKKTWNKNNREYYNSYFHKHKHDNEFRFAYTLRNHLRGVEKRKEFKDIWDDIREVYDMYGVPYHIDHMIPQYWFKINTPTSLINHLDNLQVIDADYNLSKKDRWSDPVPSEYLNKIRPYIKEERLGDLISL